MKAGTATEALQKARNRRTEIRVKCGAIITVAVIVALASIAGLVTCIKYGIRYSDKAAAFAKYHGVADPFKCSNWELLSDHAIWHSLQHKRDMCVVAGVCTVFIPVITTVLVVYACLRSDCEL